MAPAPVAALRRFVPARASKEKCDGCRAGIAPEHIHQFDPKTRVIHCACGSCAVLYRGIYRDIPTEVRALPDFSISDAQWDDLLIPISLAFFTYSSAANRIVALYPGPAGASESLLPPETGNRRTEIENIKLGMSQETREKALGDIRNAVEDKG